MNIDYANYAKQDEEQINVLQVFMHPILQSPPLFVPWISMLDEPAPSGVEVEDTPLYTTDKKIILISKPDLAPEALGRAATAFKGLADLAPARSNSVVHLGDFVARLSGRVGCDYHYHHFFAAYALADAIDALDISWPEGFRTAFGMLISHLSASKPLGDFSKGHVEGNAAVRWAVDALARNSVYLR